MYKQAILLVGLAAASNAAVIAEAPTVETFPALEQRSADAALSTCSWTGYGQTGFRDAYATISGSVGACYAMPGDAWIHKLFSAKVKTGGKVCLYTSKTCGGPHQVIDTAGYYDMTNLPAYYTWKCGAC